MYNVLVDSAGTVTCQSVMRGLRQAEGLVKNIITIDSDPMNAGRFMSDLFYKCPYADTDDYIDFLIELIDEESIDVVIPIVDSGLLNIAKNIDKFKETTTIVISPYDTIEMCDNKAKTYLMFKNAGLKTPKIYESTNEPITFPVFIKPLTGGRASLGCHKVDTPEELDQRLSKSKEPVLIMDYIDGQEYTIDVICSLDGDYIAALPRKRLMTKSGVSYKSEIVYNEDMLLEVKKLVSKVDFFGPLNIQCIEDKNGECYFIEVNPRFSGTLSATIGAGLNTVDILLTSIYNESLVKDKQFTYNKGYMLRYWSDVFVPSSYFGKDNG